jgi:hypothetical protein
MSRRCFGPVLAAFLVAGGRALAQQPAPPTNVETTAPPDVSPEVARDLARLEALLPAFAAQARATRLGVGGIFIATGLAAIPVGIVAQTSWHQDYGAGFWVTGALLLGVGTLNLVWQTPLETLEHDFHASATALPPAERLAFGTGGLSSVAASAHTGRVVGAIIDFALAGLFYGIGVGALASASNGAGSNLSDAQSGAASSLVLGAILTGGGIVQLVLPSPAETAYAVYVSGRGPGAEALHLSGGVAPVRGGALVGLGGSF